MTTVNELQLMGWNLAALLKAGGVVGERRAQVLALAQVHGEDAVATAYVSWRLKAMSQNLRLPGVWAASRLLDYGGAGAGDIHNQYAALGPVVLAYLLHWARHVHADASGYDFYLVQDVARREVLKKQLAKFWGLFRRLWPVDFGLSELAARVAALGLDLRVTQVRMSVTGDFYLIQQGDAAGQPCYQLLQPCAYGA